MSLPLEGRVVLVTRPAHQASQMTDRLEALGAQVVVMPAIEIAPPADTRPLDMALRDLENYDWVVLTSANGVEAVRRRMTELGIDKALLMFRRLAVIGPATAQALCSAFREPDLMPDEFVSESIAEALGDVAGRRFLLARADIARKDLARILTERGAVVDEVAAYRIVKPVQPIALPDQAPDTIALTSSSAVRGTKEALEEKGLERWMREAELACIGPITAQTVRELGYEVAVMADEYTIPGLVKAIADHAQKTERTHA